MSQITKINGVPIANTTVSAFTYSNNDLIITNTDGTTYSANINTMTGLTVDTISADTYVNLPVVTGSFGLTVDGAGSVITSGGETSSIFIN